MDYIAANTTIPDNITIVLKDTGSTAGGAAHCREPGGERRRKPHPRTAARRPGDRGG